MSREDSDARMHWMGYWVLRGMGMDWIFRLTECHGCWHVISVRSSMHLPIRLSGIARFFRWFRSTGEALFEGSTGESYCELSSALLLESMALQP